MESVQVIDYVETKHAFIIDDWEQTVGWMIDDVGYEHIDGTMYGLIDDMTATAFVTDVDTEFKSLYSFTSDYHSIYDYTIRGTETQGLIEDITIEIHIPLWGHK